MLPVKSFHHRRNKRVDSSTLKCIAVPRLEMSTHEKVWQATIWTLGNLTGNVACSY